jgi:hypothetical protein
MKEAKRKDKLILVLEKRVKEMSNVLIEADNRRGREEVRCKWSGVGKSPMLGTINKQL